MTDSPRTQRVRATLAAAVRIATGLPSAQPRPGQLDLVDDMTKAADPMGGHMAGIAPTGVGKALDVDTPIPTPSGWTRMGDLAVGDAVFDETGTQATVLAAHEVQLNRDCYEVVFSDGATIVADGEHLWFTTCAHDSAGSVRTTVAILSTLSLGHRAPSTPALPRSVVEMLPGATTFTGSQYIVDVRLVPSRPVRCITVSSPFHLFLAGKHMIPTHNSLSGLAEAAVGVVDYGERWILSTESIGLQAQYVDKDGPVIAKAAKEVLGKEVTVAVLKGWSNHVCAMKTRDTAKQLGVPTRAGESKVTVHADRVVKARLKEEVRVDGQLMPSAKLQPLVAWALSQHASEDLPADRGHYEGATTDLEWSAVSVSPNECIGEQMCPLAAICKPLAARQRAADADIVITNHSMLAVQAATGTPVVIGNAKLGPFSGIIVDEAHTLPGIVRKQGQSQISGGRIMSAAKKVRGITDEHDPSVRKWLDDGKHLADYVDNELRQAIALAPKDKTVKIAEDTDPFEQTGDVLEQWLRAGSKIAQNSSKVKGDLSMMIRSKRVAGDLDQAVSDLSSVREHWVGTARWLEMPPKPVAGAQSFGREWAQAQSAPVQVGRMIERNLWNETMRSEDEDEEDEIRPLTVSCISATLPEGFAREVGLKAVPAAYESPFNVAYKNSMVFIPRAVADVDINALSAVSGYSGKLGFDTAKHQAWAQTHILKLVDANRGSTLVLSATVAAGKKYAAALRAAARGRWNVYSQWDGENPRVLVSRWRDDKRSVMVGTRSLMTGVDAPGETNTLVIVDRAPRAGSNPVDDARVELLIDAGFDKFTADRLVYVSDAQLLLEQAAGRLIRSISDSGMVAVLDPRMLNAGPFKYGPQVRASYQKALERFPNKVSDPDAACAWLRAR